MNKSYICRMTAMNKKPQYIIDLGLLDWTPEERRHARHIMDTKQHAAKRQEIADKYREQRRQQKRFGDLVLPANCLDVTSQNIGQKFAIVGPPFPK